MNAFIDFCLDHVRTILFLLLFLLFGGALTYYTIPKESAPDVTVPFAHIHVHMQGVSPEDSERLILRPLEQKLRNIEGLKEMTSTGYEGGGTVLLEFIAGLDIDKILLDVRDKVDQAKADLPEEAEEPIVQEINIALFPVLVVGLSGNLPHRTLFKIAEELQERIEGLSMVLKAPIIGKREEVVEILVDPEKMEVYQLSLPYILGLFMKNNVMIPAGPLKNGSGSFTIKSAGLIKDIEDIATLPIKAEERIVVTPSNIATIRKAFKDPETFAREQGKPAVVLEVSKRAGENIIETIEKVKSIVHNYVETYPYGLHITFAQDDSKNIRDMLSELQNSIISAVLLVMLVIIASLGLRSALLVGLAVPGSFLIGIFAIGLMGYTINIVVLFSLILSVGMLVDGAIIVVEYADRKLIEGFTKQEAYRYAAKRMAWPITTSISTLLVVFIPLLFWPGITGEFMKYLPITLLATLSASLLMALVFIPALGVLLGKVSRTNQHIIQSIQASESGSIEDIKGLTQHYIKILKFCLKRPIKILAFACLLLGVIFFIYQKFGKGIEFFPNIEPHSATFKIYARGNLSIEEKDALVQKVEKKLLNNPYFKTLYTTSGSLSIDKEDLIGRITVELIDWQQRPHADVVLENALKDIGSPPGLLLEVRKDKPGPTSDKPIHVIVSGSTPEILMQKLQDLRKYLEKDKDVVDIEDNLPLPGIEWNIQVDRAKAAQYNTNIQHVGYILQMVTQGLIVNKYRPASSRDEIDIVVRFPKKYRTLQQLDTLRLINDNGKVPLSNFVTRVPKQKVSSIKRLNSERALFIKAGVAPGVLANTKVEEIKSWLETEPQDPNVNIQFKGEEQDKQETSLFLLKAFGIALFLILLILITQFNSFFSAFLILSSVVLSTFGVFVGLLVTGQPFGIVMGGIGVIALAGIIVSNNIILIDTFDRIVDQSASVLEAILRTGAQRVRPVMLTKLTTILGLLPIVFRVNIDFLKAKIEIGAPSSEWWVQLSTSIVFGVLFASFLTLVITPCSLMARENFRQWKKRKPA